MGMKFGKRRFAHRCKDVRERIQEWKIEETAMGKKTKASIVHAVAEMSANASQRARSRRPPCCTTRFAVDSVGASRKHLGWQYS